jgi:hypothetical protein
MHGHTILKKFCAFVRLSYKDKVFFNARIWNTKCHIIVSKSDNIIAGLTYVRMQLTERSCLMNLTISTPDIQKLRSK